MLTSCRWHTDIKPENIIEIGNSFKLGDPGCAYFKEVKGHGEDAPQCEARLGGTDSYGAPEVHQTQPYQTVDIWSLGCVFSVAATWTVLSCPGVEQYELLRRNALRRVLKAGGTKSETLLKSQRLTAAPDSLDCFHNGVHLLGEITGWHALLSNVCSRHDPITANLVKLIDQRMLLQDPKKGSVQKPCVKSCKT